MKRLEVTVKGKSVTIVREAEECLDSEQKYILCLSLIGCAAFLGFLFILFG